MDQLGRMLLWLGGVLVVAGLLILWGPKIPGLGRLPGDLSFETPRIKVYFPLATSIVVSLVLSLALYLWSRFGR